MTESKIGATYIKLIFITMTMTTIISSFCRRHDN